MSTPDPTFLRWRLIAAVLVVVTCAVLLVLGLLNGAEFLQALGVVWPR